MSHDSEVGVASAAWIRDVARGAGEAGSGVNDDHIDDHIDGLLRSLTVALQPIVRVATGGLFAYEALARFGEQAPEDVMADAEAQGYAVALELICLEAAKNRKFDVPDGTQLSVNLSSEALRAAYAYLDLWPESFDGIIVEVTEHTTVSLEALDGEIPSLRARGALLAVDDVGTGYAGLLRLAAMRPDLVKIDKSIVTGAGDSDIQSAVLEALVTYSHGIGAKVIAEGVETEQDLRALAEFDVDYAQGWLIGRPHTDPRPVAPDVVALCRRNRADILARALPAGGPADRTRSMHEAVSLMTLATEFADLRKAIDGAARVIGVDSVAVSALDLDDRLREVFAAGSRTDVTAYVVEDYPTTARVLATGETGEVHLSDNDGDVAEQRLLRNIRMASLLIVPFFAADRSIGILEFYQREDRHWTTVDLEQGRGLALHLGAAWERMARMSAHAPSPASPV